MSSLLGKLGIGILSASVLIGSYDADAKRGKVNYGSLLSRKITDISLKPHRPVNSRDELMSAKELRSYGEDNCKLGLKRWVDSNRDGRIEKDELHEVKGKSGEVKFYSDDHILFQYDTRKELKSDPKGLVSFKMHDVRREDDTVYIAGLRFSGGSGIKVGNGVVEEGKTTFLNWNIGSWKDMMSKYHPKGSDGYFGEERGYIMVIKDPSDGCKDLLLFDVDWVGKREKDK